MNPLELTNSDLDILTHHISNVSNNTLNLNENRVSSLSISYISYFYHVFPLHLNSFNRLFSDVISPKLSKLISSVTTFTGLTCDINQFICNLQGVSSFLDTNNPGQELLIIIDKFTGDSYLSPVKFQINKMIDELKGKIVYDKILREIYLLVKPYSTDLQILFDNFKKKIKESQSTLNEKIQAHIENIKADLTKLSSCVTELSSKITEAINNLTKNQGNLNQFEQYTTKFKLIKLGTRFTSTDGLHFQTIFNTHQTYKKCLNESSCPEIKSKLEQLQEQLKKSKKCSKELANKLEPLGSGEPNKENIESVLNSLQTFKEKVTKLDEHIEYVEKLEQIGGYITTMKTTLKKVQDKVKDEAEKYINGLEKIDITESKVQTDLKEIKVSHKLVVNELQIAKRAIEFYELLKTQLTELENLNGVNFTDYYIPEFYKNSTEIQKKLTAFQSKIEPELTKTNQEIKECEGAIEKLKNQCPKTQEQAGGEDDKLIPRELKELLTKDYTSDIPKITRFIEKSSQEIKIIEKSLNSLQENKKQSETLIKGIQSEVCAINDLNDATTKLPEAIKKLNEFVQLQEDTKLLIDTVKEHPKFKSLMNFYIPVQDLVFFSNNIVRSINNSINYVNTIKYVDSLTKWIQRCYKGVFEKIKPIFNNFKRYTMEITSKLETINCDLSQLRCDIVKCCSHYNSGSVTNDDLYKMKDYMNNLKYYLTKIKTDFRTIKIFFENLKQESIYVDRNKCELEYLEKVIEEYIKWFERWTSNQLIGNYLKEIKTRINVIPKVKYLIINGFFENKIKNIESKLSLVERSISDLECAIEAVVRNMIRSSLKSLINYFKKSADGDRGGVNTNDPLRINYSLINITNYKSVIDRLFQSSGKIDQIIKLISWFDFCFCVYSLEKETENPIEFGFIKVQEIIENLSSESSDNLNELVKLDKIKKLSGSGMKENHFCLCIIVKYLLYPTMIKLTNITVVDMEMLSTMSRKFDKYTYPISYRINLSKLIMLTIELIDKIINWIKTKYYYKWMDYKSGVAVKCFCYNYQDSSYYSIVSITLFLSTIMENISTMDESNIKMYIETLSTLVAELEYISPDTTNSIDKNKCKLVINQIVFSKCCCTTCDSQCESKCCCMTCLIITLAVYSCISLKIIAKLYEGKCDQIKERLSKFLKLLCKCNGDSCITKLLGTCEQICRDNGTCEEWFKKCEQLCTNIKCCNGECPCKNTKDCIQNLFEFLKSECDKLLDCIAKCCKNDKCKCKIMSVIKLMTKIMVFIEYRIMNEVKINSLRFGSLTWRALYNNIKILYVCYNKLMISMTKNNYGTHFNTYTDHKNIANRFPSLTMGYGYESVY